MSVIHAQSFASPTLPVTVADPDVFAADFARRAFRFEHTLAGNTQLGTTGQVDQSLLLDKLLAEVTAQAGPSATRILRHHARLITLPPHARSQTCVTRETCLILQIQGDRRVTTWDGRDRNVLSETQLERLHGRGEVHAQPPRSADHKANTFALGAGSGLHLPPHTPFWMETGAMKTCALLIDIATVATDRAAALYRANHRLRTLGLRPQPPGQSRWRDSVKTAVFAKG